MMVEAPERSVASEGGPDGPPPSVASARAAGAAEGLVRRDLASRASGEARTMLRFVIDPERRLVPDLAGRMPGRGFWVKADAASVRTALKKRVFDRHAGGAVIVPDDLPELLERLLAQRCIDAVGLGRRAGELVSGFDQVAAAVAAAVPGVLIEASDAAEHGRRKLRAKQGDGPVVACLSRAELGRALGRDAVVHAWMRNGRLATRLADDAAKLEGFRRPPDNAGDPGTGDPTAGECHVDEQQGIRRAG